MKTPNKILNSIKDISTIDSTIIERLYGFSKKSFLLIAFLSIMVTYALYPFLSAKILIWDIVFLSLITYRSYCTYLFYKKPNKFTMQTWYKKFALAAIITASIFSLLGIYFIYEVSYYYQLFIVTVLLGVSAGSISVLFNDIRLSILYILILLLPLIFSLPSIEDMPLNNMISMILLVYIITQITTLYSIYMQKKEINSLKSEHMFMHELFKNAPLGIFTYNENLKILDTNDALGDIFKRDREDLVGMNIHQLPDTRPKNVFMQAFKEGSSAYTGPYTSLFGENFWFDIKAFTFKVNESYTGIGMIENKTKEHTAIEELEYMVKHDALTGLLNRRGFRSYIQNMVTDIKHQEYYSALFYLDLNQFKSINDSMGHAIGDKILLGVSERLEKAIKDESILSRLGGDEFIVLVPYISKNEKSSTEKMKQYIKNIQRIFDKPFIVNDIHLHIQASIGIILIKPENKDTDEILRHADLTMYQAKTKTNHIAYYNHILDKKQKELFMIQHNLAYATQRNQFKLFLQPIVKMNDNSLVAAELLLRWQHPTKGLLSPDSFIDIAIKAGLLSKITWWIIDKIFAQISKWKHDNIWRLAYISININATQLIEKKFAKEFLKKLKSYGLNTSDIMLEITERSLIDNFSSTQEVINDLKSHGIKCAIDDFGIGYSSLSYLKKLSFHTLKIDRIFVKNIDINPNELILMKTILDIGRQFGYKIIIEGIEEESQKESICNLAKDLFYQGYLYSKPMSINDFETKYLAETITQNIQ